MGLPVLAGVDEAGRGPLAGPVVAAAVILPPRLRIRGVNDSKLLTASRRNQFYDLIRKKAVGIGVGFVEVEEIDRINILQATIKAMHLAILHLPSLPEKIVVDGNQTIQSISIPQTAIVDGDQKILSIMCASIIAKVTRDRWMEEAHKQYPEYGFHRHKGYGTEAHLEALARHGPSPIHRKTFSPVRQFFAGNFPRQLSCL